MHLLNIPAKLPKVVNNINWEPKEIAVAYIIKETTGIEVFNHGTLQGASPDKSKLHGALSGEVGSNPPFCARYCNKEGRKLYILYPLF